MIIYQLKKIKSLSHNELLEKYGKDCRREVSVAIFLNRPYDREKEAEMIDKLYNKLFCNRTMEHFLFNVGIFDNKHE